MAPPAIVVPLYMYPRPRAWDPLLHAAASHPSVSFIAIVNPGNGPGPTPLPDANYVSALTALCRLTNVTVLGYVYCSYGKRSLDALTGDIDSYSRWGSLSGGQFRIDGVFFDEAPESRKLVGYMTRAAQHAAANSCAHLGSPWSVMLNPGVLVPREYFDQADHVVVFEQAQAHWEAAQFPQRGMSQVEGSVRRKTVVIVHSCVGEMTRLAAEAMKLGVGGLYLTEQVGGGYSEWPRELERVVQAVEGAGDL